MGEATFASRLNSAMSLRHMKQVDFVRAADGSGVRLGKSHISQYVSGKTTPRPDIMRFLAETLNVREDWLAGKDVPMEHEPVEPDSEPPRHPAVDPSLNLHASAPESTSSSKGHPMRRFNKSTKLDNVLYDVRGPVVDEAARMEATGTHVLKLNIGNPAPFGFRTPDEVIYDMAHQLPECEGYSASKGLFSARKAIMQYAQLKNLPNVSIDDIYTGNGVSELINLSMSALLDNGDEVLIPSPDYPLWTACVNLAGGTAVHYLCDEQSEWYPDIDDMRSKITDKTKAIVVINPNNPTGALYPKEVLQQIVDLAREHQLMIFSDEIYDRLVMDGLQHISIASLAPDLFCVTFSGLSKSHMIAGYRVGWMVLSGNKNVAKDYIEGINMLTNMRICSNVPAQSIVQTALGGHQSVNDYIVPGGRIYEQRDYIYNALNSIPGVTAVKPKAAFYIFPKLDVKKFNISDDEQFALDLLHDERILITRGGGFNWHEPDHFRIVYLPRIEVLKDATTKLTEFLSYYRQ
ncbi:aminotransferase class I/II-fold pyridoxal phosphate-dependent enzyme [Bifidobacterium sp. SMB2]|uniref:alanine transaminase n=2 Tax=Bifidobacterium saimiriisciurei TaxID=2661627 RepID=A0ABX0C8Z2_9BIFI|nr:MULTISPECIES: aminotransferase class I/II-fold pyridoxal phosphate-dependent enzyme [Bifidobacterium]NEG96867.1 aminotransferase class I/II-fold pyridoxal phosphate-dependent enzyme [Bifidobacterium sp. SMB2]NEH11603.1 aminotransferase class I/II-fold pyridoxal phosphate-dependent enzyme [Bifidobacterium saimiriisciurei]